MLARLQPASPHVRLAALALLGAALLAVPLLIIGTAGALELGYCCPFCNASSQTLSEEMAASDVVLLAVLAEADGADGADRADGADGADRADGADGAEPAADAAAAEQPGPGPSLEPSKFDVVRVLKGKEHLAGAKSVEALYYGQPETGKKFLLTGMALPDVNYGSPIPVSETAVAYIEQLPGLPEEGPDRLAFFQDYLESETSLLAQDAYDEFARAPYSVVQELAPRMQHDKLVGWIEESEVSPSHRRLYLTMLGVCGNADDLPLLEKLMKAEDRRQKAGLDAMIACYLTLKGADGMPLVEELFLKNRDAEYSDTYAAIMALRFHGQEGEVIPRPRLLAGLRHMLDRPELADLVISDLARWEDWSVTDRLVRLFKEADESSNWVRVPVVNFLQAASRQEGPAGEQALALIDELAEIDPVAVKQARSFAAFGGLIGGRPVASTTDEEEPQPPAEAAAGEGPEDAGEANEQQPGDRPTLEKERSDVPAADAAKSTAPAAETGDAGAAAAVDSEATAKSASDDRVDPRDAARDAAAAPARSETAEALPAPGIAAAGLAALALAVFGFLWWILKGAGRSATAS